MSDPVCRQTVTVTMENGLHLVPCSRIAQVARRHGGEVMIHKGTLAVDAKNVLDLMTLSAEYGTELVLEADGEGAAGVISELVRLFENKFQLDAAESGESSQ